MIKISLGIRKEALELKRDRAKWKKQVKSAKDREEFVPLKEIIEAKEKEVKKVLGGG